MKRVPKKRGVTVTSDVENTSRNREVKKIFWRMYSNKVEMVERKIFW